MCDWEPVDILDSFEVLRQDEKVEVLTEKVEILSKHEKTQSASEIDPTASDFERQKTEANHRKKVEQQHPRSIIDLNISERLRSEGIQSVNYFADVKPVQRDYNDHNQNSRISLLKLNRRLFTTSEGLRKDFSKPIMRRNEKHKQAVSNDKKAEENLSEKREDIDGSHFSSENDVVIESEIVQIAGSSVRRPESVSSAQSIQSNPFLPGFVDPFS